MKEQKIISFLSKFLPACQNLISSDQVVLDTLHVEGLMFNTSFNIVEWYSIVPKSQCKYSLHLAEYGSCSIQLNHNTSVINITSFHNMVYFLSILNSKTASQRREAVKIVFRVNACATASPVRNAEIGELGEQKLPQGRRS